MKSVKLNSEPGHITKGDLFDDLGFSREETVEAKIKSDIWQALVQHIESNRLTPVSVASVLKISDADVANLLSGKFSRFSITRLIQFAGRLNLSAQVKITASKSPLASRARTKRSLVSAVMKQRGLQPSL